MTKKKKSFNDTYIKLYNKYHQEKSKSDLVIEKLHNQILKKKYIQSTIKNKNYIVKSKSSSTKSKSSSTKSKSSHNRSKLSHNKSKLSCDNICNIKPIECQDKYHTIKHLKCIVDILQCIIENIKLILSLFCLLEHDNIICGILKSIYNSYKKIIFHIYCNNEDQFLKILFPTFYEFRKNIERIYHCKIDKIPGLNLLTKMNKTNSDILNSMHNYLKVLSKNQLDKIIDS
jgi:hypothetical protein